MGVLEVWQSGVMGVGILVMGLCVGSFLNVAIYRVPRGLSVNEPKRSFCPHCKTQLPAWQNIPVVTWLLQWGKCRTCAAPIAVRYLLVEVLTGGLYFTCWKMFPMADALLAIVMLTVLVVVAFIDAEHQVIPITWTGVASVVAVVAGIFGVVLNVLGEPVSSLIRSHVEFPVVGWVVGFGSLWLVVRLGKVMFGEKKMKFEKAVGWHVTEGYEEDPQIHFLVNGEAISWDELFYRVSDELIVEGHSFLVDGKRVKGKELVLRREEFTIGDESWRIEELKSLSGKAERVMIPREAMGSGDPHLMGMIGAFLGWKAVIYTIFASSIFAIVAAVVARVGFGKPLPYGPFLALGAVSWLFGGWKGWEMYFEMLGGFGN